jgi:hypothetical protein
MQCEVKAEGTGHGSTHCQVLPTIHGAAVSPADWHLYPGARVAA